MKRIVVLLSLMSCSVAATVYKWTDEEGRVHYSQTAPVRGPSQIETLPEPSNSSRTVVTRLPPSGKKIPASTRMLMNVLAANMKSLAYDNQPLDCDSAVDNITVGLNSVNQVAQKNFKGGYIDDIELEKVQKLVRTMKKDVSVGACQQSVTHHKAFYKCMSSSYSHVLACLDKHRPSE
ncbi:DUF4124 domain-containing protein [uncultured Ferrimonas sp.]|uniref:DUF4124 domain-containing protein n=1 Tax=uncultured Ferrimonas sp. TaxID=432640 RepID=UPI002624A662|nr:DUF4124 domain-containing protein [uncultured Ferrimonas sp.]